MPRCTTFSPSQIGDTTLAAEAAGLIFRSALGGKVVETLNGGVVGANAYATLTGSSEFPTYMTPAAGVFNDRERRIFMLANDGFNPTDSVRTRDSLHYQIRWE